MFNSFQFQWLFFAGVRQNLQVVASLKPDIPASNQYEPNLAKRLVTTRAPAYTMGSKLPAKYWVSTRKLQYVMSHFEI